MSPALDTHARPKPDSAAATSPSPVATDPDGPSYRGDPADWLPTWREGAGYALLALNVVIFGWGYAGSLDPSGPGDLWLVLLAPLATHAYGLTTVISYFRNGRCRVRPATGSLYLANLLLACFSTNFALPLFAGFAGWYAALAGLTVVTLATVPLLPRADVRWRAIWSVAAGLSLAALFHAAVFLAPFVPLGAVATLFFGVGLLLLVPILGIVDLAQRLRRQRAVYPPTLRLAAWGAGLPLATLLLCVCAYGALSHDLRQNLRALAATPVAQRDAPYLELLERSDDDLIGWMTLAGGERFQEFGSWGLFGGNFATVAEDVVHDPVVMWSTWAFPRPDLDRALHRRLFVAFAPEDVDREERLRAGRFTATGAIDIAHAVDPATETARSTYTFVVESTRLRTRLGEEAIYTFQLPEGGVVTGSSLVVGGVTQPGRLATKAKAREAYRRVVGVERRDPLLLEWRPGDRIAARVFPVRHDAPRTFTVEVLAPLRRGPGGALFVEEMSLEGPSALGARIDRTYRVGGAPVEALRDRTTGYQARRAAVGAEFVGIDPQTTDTPRDVQTEHGPYRYRLTGGLSPASSAGTPLESIYLDLSSGGGDHSATTLRAVAEAALDNPHGATVYARLDGALAPVTRANLERVLAEAAGRVRSLFPVTAIGDPASSVLVTVAQRDPFSYDFLVDHVGESSLNAWLEETAGAPSLAVLQLGAEAPAPYLRGLGSYGALRLTQAAELGELTGLLSEGMLPRFPADDATAVLPDGRSIVRLPATNIEATTAPSPGGALGGDALLQLFNARIAARSYRRADLTAADTDAAMALAREANAVTPFSSHIVLETARDYRRFGIDNVVGPDRAAPPPYDDSAEVAAEIAAERAVAAAAAESDEPDDAPATASVDDRSALDVAFDNGAGSVPEPHEWALIALTLLAGGLVYTRRPA